ncbi:Pentatricopeptide repeat-containing protein [Hirschfeldia incana]|nr:Pentatricopeptide repeat-containing protein [Hirschfeldia incana]
MYRKLSLFPRANYARHECRSSSQRLLRHLNTAVVERLGFLNPNEHRLDDSSHISGDINPRPAFNGNEVSESVAVRTQSQSWGSNYSQGNFSSSSAWNSDYRNGWGSGNNNKIEETLEEFDSHCEQYFLKMALEKMESLENQGHFLDLPRLLRLAHLCGDEHPSLESNALREAKVSIQGKIRGLVYHSDPNHLKYYTDLVIEEFDAFCRQGNVKKAIHTMDTLASLSYVVDLDRLLRLAKLCGEVEASQEAKFVHGKISSLGLGLDASSYHVLIEMYSNCGLMNEASSVFEEIPERKSLETWCVMIRCLARNGLGEDAIDMFTRFKNQGNKPDGPLFRGVFYACGLLGDVDEGMLHFTSMYKDYGIVPTVEDYASVVEMFALPGLLDEALAFVERMPMEANADVWETLMNLSRVHGDLELGDRCAEVVEELDPTRLNQQSRDGYLPVKASDVEKAILKKRSGIHGLARIATNRSHEYRAGDTNLPENDELLKLLRNLRTHMLERGYVCQTKLSLHDVDEESKENALLAHSERIAFARALLNTAPRHQFTILKNLRVCIDCHNALKIMADIVGRTVIMRDAKRFHHLKDGGCSCRDYW